MKKPEFFLQHIFESIGDIERYTKDLKANDFYKNTQIQDAVIRKLEIIGEAVKNIPKVFKNKHPQIPWQKIAGTRDILIHEYFGVDLNLVWIVVKKELPKLKKEISNLIAIQELFDAEKEPNLKGDLRKLAKKFK